MKAKFSEPNHYQRMLAAMGYICQDSAQAALLTEQLEKKMIEIADKASSLSSFELTKMLTDCDTLRMKIKELYIYDDYHRLRKPKIF